MKKRTWNFYRERGKIFNLYFLANFRKKNYLFNVLLYIAALKEELFTYLLSPRLVWENYLLIDHQLFLLILWLTVLKYGWLDDKIGKICLVFNFDLLNFCH
jgi:hypothetical protein